jgi:FkbM family methyltransferase
MLIDLNELKNKYDLKIKGVIHIGAHYGEEFNVYDKLKIKNIIFFEPLLENFKILKERIGDKAILVNKALGNENKKITMNVETNNQGQSSSILEPHIHLTQYPWIIFNKKEIVEMVRLDDELKDNDKYNFINIDVQGYELEVFKGSSQILKNVDYIMTEVNKSEVYKNCAMVEDLDNFLSKFNFKRVETTWDGITWGDAFYIKNQ